MKKILIIDNKKEQVAALGRTVSEYYIAPSEYCIYTYDNSISRLRSIIP